MSDLVSIIVTAYNVEVYIEQCLKYILSQTYEEIEVIVVDDGSNDNTNLIVEKIIQSDNRVRIVNHGCNRGLFQARITGVENSKGEYIIFVDADDCISIDWVRTLVNKQVETKADVVIGDFALLLPNDEIKYYSLDPLRCSNLCLSGEEIMDAFMRQRGTFYGWHTIWNKLYVALLWKTILPEVKDFSEEYGHLVMTEDMAFSSCIFLNSKKMVNTHHNSNYYYNRKDVGRSTDTQKSTEQFKKNVRDVQAVFNFFERELKKHGVFEKYENDFIAWKCRYGRIYWGVVDELSCSTSQKAQLYNYVNSSLNTDVSQCQDRAEKHLYSEMTDLTDVHAEYDRIKRDIKNKECEYVSFDIFDTLILRPFFHPTDLFSLLDEYYKELIGGSSQALFSEMRVESERNARDRMWQSCRAEEITLDEIYEQIQMDYVVPTSVLNSIKKKEKDLEIKYCYARNTGKDLYDLAKYLGKKILLTSDMYLDSATVDAILTKCGYDEYQLFLSSVHRKSKFSGNLFKLLMKQLNINEASKICHIGDNLHSDVKIPASLGIKTHHMRKTTEMLTGSDSNNANTPLFDHVMHPMSMFIDVQQGFASFLGLRCAWALVANKLFDNPYIDIKPGTDFNQNPYFVGYCALGMHLLSFVTWVINANKDREYTIHFVARDGYLPKLAFDLLNDTGNLKTNYLRVSRKAILTADMKCPTDLYSILHKMNVLNTNPIELVEVLSVLFGHEQYERILTEIRGTYDNPQQNFLCVTDYEKFIKFFIDTYGPLMNFDEKDAFFKKVFGSVVKKGDMIFDIGYNGRTEAALSNILGFPISSYYIHINSDVANLRMTEYGFEIKQYYDYKPSITGVMREHMLMEMCPSTERYDLDTGEPVFGAYDIDYPSYVMTKITQNAALDFCKDFKTMFNTDVRLLHWRKYDMSMPMEHYLHTSSELDRRIFGSLIFEDKMGGGRCFNALSFWNEEIDRVANETGARSSDQSWTISYGRGKTSHVTIGKTMSKILSLGYAVYSKIFLKR